MTTCNVCNSPFTFAYESRGEGRGEGRGASVNRRSWLASSLAALASGAVFGARVKGPRVAREWVFTFALPLYSGFYIVPRRLCLVLNTQKQKRSNRIMDWSQDETFKFIELFQKERIIWDPKHKCHKNSQKVSDAWARLSEIMGRSQTELKNKKNSLMATFRQLLRRKKQSVRSGAGEDDIYKPVWLYYDAMETFLASIYECNTTVSTEERQVSKIKLSTYLFS